MARNYLIFFFGLIVVFIFSFIFCYTAVYSENLVAGILAVIGLLATMIICLIIGLASREEGGTLYIYFFAVLGLAELLFVWFLTRAGVLLQIW
jgi:hypothetical protein